MKKLFTLLLLLLASLTQAQFSKTHYIPPISGSDNVAAQEHYFYISTPSTTPVNVRINALGVGTSTVIVSQSAPYIALIGNTPDTQMIASPNSLNTKLSNKGYIIEAESLIYVSVRVLAGGYNQAGSIVSKGTAALGKQFRVGAFINTGTPVNPSTVSFRYTFLSILATENNTTIEFKDIKPGVVLINNPSVGNVPPPITLNRGQSYLLAVDDSNSNSANKDGLIGALVKSDKPIAFNCGSFGGTNGNNSGNLDLGFDQIVPIENIKNTNSNETEYIFVKGGNIDIIERPLIVAHEDNTEVYINGNAVPIVLNMGQYVAIDGSLYSVNRNMYVKTSKPAFAYQSIGGSSQANQQMFFVPPLNCSTPNIVNNIPYIEQIGNRTFLTNSGLNIVTETGATLQLSINGTSYPITSLPAGVFATAANAVTGNANYETYTITGLTGNIGVFSNKQVYVSFFGTNGAATYGGYYSGFDLKPEIVNDISLGATSNCIPNVLLKINTLSAYNTFKWYKNDIEIPGETSSSYKPTTPGFYQVSGAIAGCGSSVFSDKIPVSECPTNLDGDVANDNVDIDNDNDGITNCFESFGNQTIDLTNSSAGTVAVGSYSNPFTGIVTTSGNATPSTSPFVSSADGSFVTDLPIGKTNSVTYKMTFAQPITIGLDYVATANASDLLNADAEYVVNSDLNKTVTVLNPSDQLLIDTNYDGIYESGVTQHSSFEIRFKMNSAIPLAAGTGTFRFVSYLTNSLSFTHKNTSDDVANKSTMKFFAVCVPKDIDGDGLADQLDPDSDNDGILDTLEAQGNTTVAIANADTNKNGLDNAFEPGFTPVDTDTDSVPDYLDLDSDNDGVLDAVETGADQDADGVSNYRDLDRENDLCNDVIEAGFNDTDGDGKFGIAPISVDSNGRVIGAPYTAPNPNYTIGAPIVITVQPTIAPTCELQNATITLTDNGGNTYQWQSSSDGITWITLANNPTYAGVTTNTLQITKVVSGMNGMQYRVQLNKIGNSCGLISQPTTLNILALPIVTATTIIQCDDNTDGISQINLTVNNTSISSNSTNETFTYYTSFTGATTANPTELIATPLAFTNTTPGTMQVWSRVVNSNGCFSVAQITLKVLATQIPNTFKRSFEVCDDFLDIDGLNNTNNNKRDGVATFNFSSVTTDIQTLLPLGNYTVTYYRNQADAFAELNPIVDPSNYRNIGYANSQVIWGRVDSDVDNACFGIGPYINLTVEKLPFANPVTIARQCDDNQDGIFTFNTAALETTLKGSNQSFPISIAYFDAANNPLKDATGILINSPFPPTFTSTSQTIKAVVTNATTLKCTDETTIVFTVDDLPEAFPIAPTITTACDDEADPLSQDGKFAFDTSTIQATLLGAQTGLVVSYVDQSGTALPSPLPNPFITATQTITATIENPINTNCKATYNIPFIVNPVPNINLNTNGLEDQLVCTNLPTFTVQLNGGINDGSPTTNYTYVWKKDGAVLSGQTNYTLDVNSAGLYTVDVITLQGCSRTRTIKVTASDIAKIESVEVVDLTDVNKVTINVSGTGDYEYSLNDATGPFSYSNVFENIPSGIHTIYVNDKNGCGIVSKEIAVVGAPKYFTPNGDGYNDYWNVKGTNTAANSKSVIRIFDRYGKLLKQIFPNSNGWDGTFNGQPLPSDDYWYTVVLEDGREIKGHFALKR